MNKKPEGPIERPHEMATTEEAILEFVLHSVAAPARHSARNAVHNLGLSEKLASVDLNEHGGFSSDHCRERGCYRPVPLSEAEKAQER